MPAPGVIAADLGGTFTKFGVVDADGSLTATEQLRTPVTDGGLMVVEWLAEQLTARATEHGLQRFGVATPGIIDEAKGVVVAAPNIGWSRLPLSELLEQMTGLEGTLTHDVRAGGRAEARVGAGTGVDNAMFVPLGTGIAAAVMVDGRVLEAGGYAGELGHIRVPAAGDVRCACGQLGCLEVVASAAGVRRTYQRITGIEMVEVPETVEIARRAIAGDRASSQSLTLAGVALGEAFVIATTLFGPERIILGGGLAGAFDELEPVISEKLATMTFQRRPEIVRAELGSRAGVTGAGLTTWERTA
ncbi:ROK family protein [Propionibacteriaceae bacterium Y1700]|uniref:ROK family protein n=1 Tax=Microlunatus sp. Y1700 TaxID=3418487 RepID=UPI003DA70F10